MIKDFLISFKDNFKTKTRNPFLGTYLMVWIVRNWELVYTLLNFDNEQKLKDRVDFIEQYYTDNNFLENLWTNLYWAFALLVLTFILLNMSRLIVNLFEKRLTPWIYKITDSKSIVLKETYDKLKEENLHLEGQLEKERGSKGRLQNEILKLEERIEKSKKVPEIETIDSEQSSSEKITLENEVNVMFNKIYKKNWENDYLRAISLVNSTEHGWVNNREIGDSFNYFITLGLIGVEQDDGSDSRLFITDLGKSVLRRVRLEL